MLLLILTALFITLVPVYIFLYYKSTYWKRRGVVQPKAKIIVGNYGNFILMKQNYGINTAAICEQFPDEPFVGAIYGTEPVLIIKDPELIKLVMAKDFAFFSSRELSEHKHREELGQNIFNEDGDNWKVTRLNLTPMFTSAKMKSMFYLVKNCTKDLVKLIEKDIEKNETHEVKSLMARYAMDSIGSCVLGVESKVMGDNLKNNPFRRIADTIFSVSFDSSLKFIMRSIWPNIFYAIGYKAIPDNVTNFFNKIIKGVFNERNNKPGTRNDFIDILLNMKNNNYITGDGIKTKSNDIKNNAKVSLKVDDTFLISQAMALFAAGFDTSATTSSFTLYELAKNKEAQKRAAEEIDEYLSKRNGEIDFSIGTDLPYLEACLDEAIRLYPVLASIAREAVQDYVMPSGLKLEKGMRVQIPAYYLHHNPAYFPNPEDFRPERFLSGEKENITPYTYLPFGEGPRFCIGMRFAKMQVMAGLVSLLNKFEVELADDMPKKVDFQPRGLVTQSKCGINLKFKPRIRYPIIN